MSMTNISKPSAVERNSSCVNAILNVVKHYVSNLIPHYIGGIVMLMMICTSILGECHNF